MGKPSRLTPLLGVLAILVAVGVVTWLATRARVESPADLARTALESADDAEQERAAVRLEMLAGRAPATGPRNPAQPYLVRLLQESRNPGVRAAALRGLAGIWDYEQMASMLDLLDDESPRVRGAAGVAVESLLSSGRRFDASAEPEQRRAVVTELRQMWKAFSETTLPRWQRRLEEGDARTGNTAGPIGSP